MYLKNVTVLGFKSFPDKTALDFQPGITAIVGPNGCGKSNIADAIRWVLGEQSAKALRGDEMADVIFNGTDARRPLSLAEVSLTIGDVDQERLRASGVELAYNEVTLTRRVFRDGTGEYFLNRTPCRLKDIQQLFLGTGVGRASYSIMAQGHVTQLLSSRPEDRRAVFEEAAGITRFKAQKREALRKLEQTEQNLLRLSDLIREVKRQIGSLQRQAGKARRYRQLMLELQHLETQLARHQFDLLEAERRERQAAADQLRFRIETGTADILRDEEKMGQLREQLSALEQRIHEAQQRGQELKAQTEHHESRVHFNQERLRELETQNAKALGDISQGEERRRAAEEEQATVTDRLTASTQSLQRLRETLQTQGDALRQIETEQQTRQEALRQTQAEAFQLAQDASGIRNQITAIDLQKQANAVRVEKLSAEKIQLEEERARLENRLRDFAAALETEKRGVTARRLTVADQQRQLQEIQVELEEAGQALERELQEQAERRSRLAVLEQLQADYEGFTAGALAVLKERPQILGALVDRIRVPESHIQAIETALGHHLQLALTDSPQTAAQIIADLKATRKGRASIAPLALNPSSADAPAPPAEDPARDHPGLATALSVIEVDAAVQPLLQRLLGRTLIVPDLEVATRLWRERPGGFDFVTPTGEILDRHGVYTGGAGTSAECAPSSLLARKNQIAALQLRLAEVQKRISETSQRKGTLQREQTALQIGLEQALAELSSEQVAIATHEGECKALASALQSLGQKIDTVVYEIQSLAAQEAAGGRQLEALSARDAEIEERERANQTLLAEVTRALETLRAKREAATNALTESRVAAAAEEQLSASFRQQQQAFEQRARELTQLVEQRRREISSLIERRARFEAEIEESRRLIESLRQNRADVNTQTADLLLEKATREGEIAQHEEQSRERRRHVSQWQEQRAALDVELAQKDMAVQNLRERIQQKYKLNLDEVRSECITITIADEGPANVQTLTPEEMAARGLATDWDLVAQQVAALQTRLDEMGPVNLVAIEEYEETEQRHQFLTAQNDDLLKAKAQLLEVINRVNTQTRELFQETFAKIREQFSALFSEVFDGGKADLRLVDERDVLESGIEIMARPPGKQLKSISLLSGGEQTMTAVALLFAIYVVRPSPFCVLDELDAALDEANIGRFARVLQRFLAQSQFVVITHNKRTIAMADVIYGVTMQEHGISKIVSLKFHKPSAASATGPAETSLEEEGDRLQEPDQVLEEAMAK